MTNLGGKIALVTGASSGIGRACARVLAGQGARVIATARRLDRVEALCAELEAETPSEACRARALDVRDRSAIAAMLNELNDSGWGEIDILVNNAGLAAGLEKVQEGDFDNWDRMLDTNVKGLMNVTRLVVPGMVERGYGHIVNLGSIAGRETYISGNVYCASKAAVRAFNKALRLDLLGTGIRVTTLDPGLVKTEFSLVRFDGNESMAEAPYKGMTPLSAEDVADALLWAVTRPAHVNVEEILLMPSDQASATQVHRE
jgi:serine 3-dehydrogenase